MINKSKNTSYSSIALIACYLLMSYTAFVYHPRWKEKNTEATISWDVSGYYMYLPALFIYKDIKQCSFKDSILKQYYPTPDFQQAFMHEASGNYVMKYAAGQAVIMAPFFAIGHTWALNSASYTADGFSFPYQVTLGVGMFLIAFLGLFVLRKILILYFRDSTVAILLLLYVFGTNYLNYSSVDQAMTHNSLFTIYALLVWTCIHFYKKKKTSSGILIGILCGLATLIRPTELISILIPILWGVSTLEEFKERFTFFSKHYSKLILAAFLFILIVFIQPFYWHYATGDWIVYSYQDQGFSFLKPHLWDYTMSYRCGWLRYCPMMFLPFIGFYFYFKGGKNKWAVILFSFLAFYVTIAWDVWDYGGTAGRAMVQYYVVLAFPFAALIEKVHEKKTSQYIFYPIALLFAYINIWGIRAGDGNIQLSGGTRQYYWAVIGRWTAEDETKKLLDTRHIFKGQPNNPTVLYTNSLANDTTEYDYVNELRQLSENYQFKNNNAAYKWFRISADFDCIFKEWDEWKQAQYRIIFYHKSEGVQTNGIRLHRFINNGETKNLFFDIKTPKEWDYAKLHLWNSGSKQELRFRNAKVIGFND